MRRIKPVSFEYIEKWIKTRCNVTFVEKYYWMTKWLRTHTWNIIEAI
jgi:hypothetical protein